MAGDNESAGGRDAAGDAGSGAGNGGYEPGEDEPDSGPLGIVIPPIPAEQRDRAVALARHVALRTEQLLTLLHRARELGFPDPAGVGYAGLDYEALDAVTFGLLTWSGALLRAADEAGDWIVPPPGLGPPP